jgi:hypothetical protein
MSAPLPVQQTIDDTRRWLERAVIGLNLCPFAKSVHAKGQVHYAVTEAIAFGDVLEALQTEAESLWARDAAERDTTLLVLTGGEFRDFLVFNMLVREAERLLSRRWAGVLQLANFHPAFVFADAAGEDPGNFSNRSPHPTLHLLREASIDRAVAAFPEAEAIFGANIERLRQLGPEGWAKLGVGPT